MIWTLALTVFVSVGAGVYLVLSRDLFRCVLGLSVLGAAANLVLLASGRIASPHPAVVPIGQQALGEAANALPQALVLTAIVIGFALLCFALVLALRLIQLSGSDDAEQLRYAEPLPTDPLKPPVTEAALDPLHPGFDTESRR